MNIIGNLISGFSRSIAIWASAWLGSHHIISATDSGDVEKMLGVLLCGFLWAGIHWVEDKFKKKAE